MCAPKRVVDRLHALNRQQLPGLITHLVRRSVLNWLKGSTLKLDTEESYLSDKFISLDPAKCELCYALCAASKAKNVVEAAATTMKWFQPRSRSRSGLARVGAAVAPRRCAPAQTTGGEWATHRAY